MLPQYLRNMAKNCGYGQTINDIFRQAAKKIESNANSLKKRGKEIKRLKVRMAELEEHARHCFYDTKIDDNCFVCPFDKDDPIHYPQTTQEKECQP